MTVVADGNLKKREIRERNRQPARITSRSGSIRLHPPITKLTYLRQPTDWSCGVTVFRMACLFFGLALRQYSEDLLLLGTNPSEGTSQERLVFGLIQRLGAAYTVTSGQLSYASQHKREKLLELIQTNALVIVNYREPEEHVGHYAIVQTVTKSDVVLADPWHGLNTVVPLELFDWRNGSDIKTIYEWFVAIRVSTQQC